MKIIFISHANKTHFHMKGFALGLVLKVIVYGARKRSIEGGEGERKAFCLCFHEGKSINTRANRVCLH